MGHGSVEESVRSGAGLVVSPDARASAAGHEVLEEGGGAIEAVIAMAAVLAVVAPHRAGLGGDGLWLIRDSAAAGLKGAGRVGLIEAAGTVASRASYAYFRNLGHDTIPAHGPLAALTVPGMVAGWEAALESARRLASGSGRAPMPARRLLEPALALARAGIAVSGARHRLLAARLPTLAGVAGFADAFLAREAMTGGGTRIALPAEGTVEKPERLADTLEQLGRAGLMDFYRGDIGREMAADLEQAGSPLTRADLALALPAAPEPLTLTQAGTRLIAPRQALGVLAGLGIFSRLSIPDTEGFSAHHGLIEALRRARRLAAEAGDAPADHLTATALESEAMRLDPRRVAPPGPPGSRFRPHRPEGGSAFLAATDRAGRMVGLTLSMGDPFGSGLVLPATGILVGNGGSGLALDPAAGNALLPGQRAPSVSVPLLVEREDGCVLLLGVSGAANGQGDAGAQVLAQLAARLALAPLAETSLATAINAPRWLVAGEESAPDLWLEPELEANLADRLDHAGHRIASAPTGLITPMGEGAALIRHPLRGGMEAVADPRGEGAALGL